jgi:hypothetical protein
MRLVSEFILLRRGGSREMGRPVHLADEENVLGHAADNVEAMNEYKKAISDSTID